MSDKKLTNAAKTYVVMQLAMFESPSIIQKELKEQFGVEVSLPNITQYDPTKGTPRAKWQELFDETRRKFIEDTAAIPIAHKNFRLRELNRLFHNQKLKPEKNQNTVEARAILEQAAKESGDGYTNRRELTGKDGKPLIPETGAGVVIYIPDNGRGDAKPAIDITPDPASSADANK